MVKVNTTINARLSKLAEHFCLTLNEVKRKVLTEGQVLTPVDSKKKISLGDTPRLIKLCYR